MKSAKRFKIQQDKKQKKQGNLKGGGKSRYAIKRDAQKRGMYLDTSPLRFGPNAEE